MLLSGSANDKNILLLRSYSILLFFILVFNFQWINNREILSIFFFDVRVCAFDLKDKVLICLPKPYVV